MVISSHALIPTLQLLTGSFSSLYLFLLSFNPATNQLSISRKISGLGPHQFLCAHPILPNIVYATSWAIPSTLSAWSIDGIDVELLNSVEIAAAGSYITIHNDLMYSAGGPTGEIHQLNCKTGKIEEKVQDLLYVPSEELELADKSRKSLRYGSHGIDISLKSNQVFVPHLGENNIYIYSLLPNGKLDLVVKAPSFGSYDGPRHVLPSPNGIHLYVVTEHTSYVDVYSIQLASLTHLQRLSIIPSQKYSIRSSYRGDTLKFSPSRNRLYTTTRGMTSATQGFITTFEILPSGLLSSESIDAYQTRNSGGKANAIDVRTFEERELLVLTDDEEGWVEILEWNQVGLVKRGEVQLKENVGIVGASHAVWLQ